MRRVIYSLPTLPSLVIAEFRFDPVDEVALSDFRNLIW